MLKEDEFLYRAPKSVFKYVEIQLQELGNLRTFWT